MIRARSSSDFSQEARPVFFTRPRRSAGPPGAPARPRLLACVDEDVTSAAVLPHARAVANALGLSVTVGRVIETPRAGTPADPIEWTLRRDQHQARLAELVDEIPRDGGMASVLLSGPAADELAVWGRENGATVLALARCGSVERHGLGSTAQRLLEGGTASLLLVPPSEIARPPRYRLILVPIDGSLRSESVLPVAARIARAQGAELMLVHVVPRLEILDEDRLARSRDLQGEVDALNERNARAHLKALRSRFAGDGLAVRTLVAGPGDARTILRRIVSEQNADLVVLSSHGRTGLTDVACGSVAEYLAIHAPVPLLLVRPSLVCRFRAAAPGLHNGIGALAL